MDYSLLVGFTSLHNEQKIKNNSAIVSSVDHEAYNIAIIDFLQKYNYNKKSERFIKVYLQCYPKDQLSVQPPLDYMNRWIRNLDVIIESHDLNIV